MASARESEASTPRLINQWRNDASLADLIDAIVERNRMREDSLNAEKTLTLQIKAICRRLTYDREAQKNDKAEADALYEALVKVALHAHPMAETAAATAMPLVEARNVVTSSKNAAEREMEKLAKRLPVASWVATQRGVGIIGLGQIVGECGDLSKYPTKEKLWKRMGVHVVDGAAAKRRKGEQMDWSARRRAVLWNIGNAFKRCEGPYRDVYLARKQQEVEKAAQEGLEVLPAAEIEKRVKKGEPAERFRSLGHIDNRARRYAEKRLLRDLWKKWRAVHGGDDSK